jgi:hypothetical protein
VWAVGEKRSHHQRAVPGWGWFGLWVSRLVTPGIGSLIPAQLAPAGATVVTQSTVGLGKWPGVWWAASVLRAANCQFSRPVLSAFDLWVVLGKR